MIKSDSKKIVFKRLDAALKPLGWKSHKSGYNPSYTYETDKFRVSFDMVFKSQGDFTIGNLNVQIKEVELLLLKVLDKDFVAPGFCESIPINERFTISARTILEENIGTIETEEEANHYLDLYLNYLFKYCKQFLETYLYLPNVVRNMNECMKLDLPWQNHKKGIMEHIHDAYFRGLIISKLCNDPDFEGKCLYVENDMKEDPDFWDGMLPYYEKLKDFLPTIEPIYSMDDPNEEQKLAEIRKNLKGFDRIEPVKEEKKPVAVEKKEPLTPPNLDDIVEGKSILESFKSLFGNAKQPSLTPGNSEEILHRTIFELAKRHGFEDVKWIGPMAYFRRKTPLGNAILPVLVKNNGTVIFWEPSIRINRAEEWMRKLSYPKKHRDYEFIGTVILPLPKDILILQRSIRESKSLEDFKQLCIKVWMFLEENLETFLSTYTTYQSVWEQLCRLEDNNEGWDNFLRGLTSSERILRGIILEKFCEDEETWEKFVLYEDAFNSYEELKDWRPAVEQLRNMLDDIKTEES